VQTYDLKKRNYISTTSMDSELALLTANMTFARPGSVFYDPFVGTASLPIACSHFGAMTVGSDMDGRSVRGVKDVNVRTSYAQYGLQGRYLGGFVSDLTNSPVKLTSATGSGLFDGIVCDPPYGVREGLKVLGGKADVPKEVWYLENGQPSHLADDYVPPKRPYSFEVLLADILDFAAQTLVVNGRLSMWMPVANDEDGDLRVPMHASLDLTSNCVQPFNRWSRRLLTYKRRNDDEVKASPVDRVVIDPRAKTADDLNSFRKRVTFTAPDLGRG